jgi:hypothetical protein
MPGQDPAPATFYRPAEVAAMLHCSQWWVKEQARRRRIPFCWIGGSYRFTAEHVAEIARLFEVRPIRPADPVSTPVTAGPPVHSGHRGEPADAVDAGPTPLRARTPRRIRPAA